ncbi:MAG: hypothetical protein IPL65_19595 [Lewinellaceae bacterium]|nr:hypothetical protein [Lewinellaceae bacterium]
MWYGAGLLRIENLNFQIWEKQLSDGSKAVGIFNMQSQEQEITLRWTDIGFKQATALRDLWRQQDLPLEGDLIKLKVPRHGCYLLKITP